MVDSFDTNAFSLAKDPNFDQQSDERGERKKNKSLRSQPDVGYLGSFFVLTKGKAEKYFNDYGK